MRIWGVWLIVVCRVAISAATGRGLHEDLQVHVLVQLHELVVDRLAHQKGSADEREGDGDGEDRRDRHQPVPPEVGRGLPGDVTRRDRHLAPAPSRTYGFLAARDRLVLAVEVALGARPWAAEMDTAGTPRVLETLGSRP